MSQECADRSSVPSVAQRGAFGEVARTGSVSPELLEGEWVGDLIAIAFPDLDRARGWYESPDYQRILPLRAENSTGEIILIDGVDERHRATDILGERT
jgi:uncharacterized protein (DUF1330 family)